MLLRNAISRTALAAALTMVVAAAFGEDASKYPDWSGQWMRAGGGAGFDPNKPTGRGQEAPLTPEYQAIFEAGLADYAQGGQGNNPTYLCIPGGMPRMMTAPEGVEFVVTPATTYLLFGDNLPRRIYTDGRARPSV